MRYLHLWSGRRWLDSANRSFVALVAIALVPYALLGLFGCGLLSLAGYRLATDGLAGLNRDGQDLRPGVVFFAVVTAGTVAAAVSIRRQVRATRSLAAHLQECTMPAPGTVAKAAEDSGLSRHVDVIDDPEPWSFTYGVISARVAVSRGLVEALDTEQLVAVLQHERYHVRNRDTLKMVVARAAPVAFFFLPALANLRTRYLAGRELAADRAALGAVGTRPLAGALFQVLEGTAPDGFGAAAALGGAEFLDLRVTQLETGDEPSLAQIPRWRVAVTVAGLAVLSAAFLLTATRTNGSMTMMGDADRPGGTAVSVLGAVACMAAWAWIGLLVIRRVIGHKRLTPTASR
jgi:Zn-dependent protease with chaperone function